MTNPIVHFEIPADDVKRAKRFYEGALGWTIEEWPGMDYYVVYTKDKEKGVGIDGGLMKRKNAGQPFMNYISVQSIDAVNKTITSTGGTIVMPKTEISPGMGWVSAFIDTEGNIIGLHEEPLKKGNTKK